MSKLSNNLTFQVYMFKIQLLYQLIYMQRKMH